MPCNTIQRSKVQFLPTSTDTVLLTKALQALGYEVSTYGSLIYFQRGSQTGTYNATTGELQTPERWDTGAITRGYSEQIVESQAERFGWELEWSTNESGNREATVKRSTY